MNSAVSPAAVAIEARPGRINETALWVSVSAPENKTERIAPAVPAPREVIVVTPLISITLDVAVPILTVAAAAIVGYGAQSRAPVMASPDRFTFDGIVVSTAVAKVASAVVNDFCNERKLPST